jgi:hypothetical protein
MVNVAHSTVTATATTAQIVAQAKAAAAEYDGPIQRGTAVEQPSSELVQNIIDMGKKQAEILNEAAKQIDESGALDAALAGLVTATQKLKQTAAIMVDATTILNKINKFLGYGTDAANAVKSVQK